jgi:hypothetical protein
MQTKICEACGKEFKVHDFRANEAKYCSMKCSGIGRAGRRKTYTEEDKLAAVKRSIEKNAIKGKEGECWGWKASTIRHGYPQLTCKYSLFKHKNAAIGSYVIHKGPIPEGMVVMHTCNNPICTNPDHLEIGTQQQNIDYKVSLNRQNRGEKVNTAKLTEEQVREIRKLMEDGVSVQTVAVMYGMSNTTVYDIKKRKIWKHLV